MLSEDTLAINWAEIAYPELIFHNKHEKGAHCPGTTEPFVARGIQVARQAGYGDREKRTN